jgi:hypothetical protein
MTLTKAYVVWFDGHNGEVVDYLGNQIWFSYSQVVGELLPYMVPGQPVLLEFTTNINFFITSPETSFFTWTDEQNSDNVYELDEDDAESFEFEKVGNE